MAWTAPKTWVSGEDVDFNEFNTHIRDNLNETAPGKATTAGRMIITDGANSIVERIPTTATVATSETTSSSSYTDLATSGPSVTVTTGTAALVYITAEISNTGSASNYVGYAVSGATTTAASDERNLRVHGAAAAVQKLTTVFLASLTAGSNTFKLEYKTDSGTATFLRRSIVVIPF